MRLLHDLNNIDTVILCGGLGTRLRPVVFDRPKVLATMEDRPFFNILLEYIVSLGLRKFILSTGYLGEHIKEYIKSGFSERPEIKFIFSQENKPLGTGGALKQALSYISGEPFFVFNGDSFCEINLGDFFNFHRTKDAHASMAIVDSPREDGGSVAIDHNYQITNFSEKNKESKSNFINAGVYLMDKRIKNLMPSREVFSLEYDLFPRLTGTEKFFGFPAKGRVIDIGTPERYQEAINYFKNIKSI